MFIIKFCQWLDLNRGRIWSDLFAKWATTTAHVFQTIQEGQCDQMGNIFFGLFARMKNCHNNIKLAKLGSNICQILTNPQKLPKTFKILPKRWIFDKSGHTEEGLKIAAYLFKWKSMHVCYWSWIEVFLFIFKNASTVLFCFVYTLIRNELRQETILLISCFKVSRFQTLAPKLHKLRPNFDALFEVYEQCGHMGIFSKGLGKKFPCKNRICFDVYMTNLKNTVATFKHLWEKIWLLVIPTSGHTVHV